MLPDFSLLLVYHLVANKWDHVPWRIYVWHDSVTRDMTYLYGTWLMCRGARTKRLRTRPQTSNIMCHDVFTYDTTQLYVSWLDFWTHFHAGYDSFIRDMTHKGGGQCHTASADCPQHIFNVTHVCTWHDSFIHVTWLCGMTHNQGSGATRLPPSVTSHMWRMYPWDMTHSVMWHLAAALCHQICAVDTWWQPCGAHMWCGACIHET